VQPQKCHVAPLHMLQYEDSLLHAYMDSVVGDEGIQDDDPFSLSYPNNYNACLKCILLIGVILRGMQNRDVIF
jgi:hypothetical protein